MALICRVRQLLALNASVHTSLQRIDFFLHTCFFVFFFKEINTQAYINTCACTEIYRLAIMQEGKKNLAQSYTYTHTPLWIHYVVLDTLSVTDSQPSVFDSEHNHGRSTSVCEVDASHTDSWGPSLWKYTLHKKQQASKTEARHWPPC